MKTFFGSIFIEKSKLIDSGIFHPIKLEYYKLISEDINIMREYGIKIIKTEYKKGEINIEEKEVENLTNDENIINKVLDLFKRNEVTPVAAEYIIEDLYF